MTKEIEIQEFINRWGNFNVIDVRSPLEFSQGHIPGAFNLPLFDDCERALIGTIYKQNGKEKALSDGLEIAGKKLSTLVTMAREISGGKEIIVHCWRGGMRSKSVAWLLDLSGIITFCLIGGYKSFRSFALKSFERKADLRILSGYTGCGKTDILNELEKLGQQVIDIEQIAIHKGSAFGNIENALQPTTEQFQNDLFAKWNNLDLNKPVWVEDESINIGKVCLPDALFRQILEGKIITINLRKDLRVKRLVRDYNNKELLAISVKKLEKKLGSELCRKIIELIVNNDLEQAAENLLDYYDKTYDHSISRRMGIRLSGFDIEDDDVEKNTKLILNTLSKLGFC